MPIEGYYKGKGREVAKEMKKRYGKRWERIFYATANKLGLKPREKYSKAERILSGME